MEILTETVQVIDAEEDGCCRLWPAALAWVKDPSTLINRHLDSLHNRELLTWHKVEPNGPSLPEDEIWVKISGDKGGGSFKVAFQIVNQPKPNLADHTTVISFWKLMIRLLICMWRLITFKMSSVKCNEHSGGKPCKL